MQDDTLHVCRLSSHLRVPKTTLQRLVAVESTRDIRGCKQEFSCVHRDVRCTGEPSDTVTVSVSWPVLTQDRRQALVYLEQVVRPQLDSTLSGGDRGSGVVYLLQPRTSGWVVVRSATIWVMVGQ